MSYVQRASWAAQVPASGILGVIPKGNLPASTGKVTDIGDLTAAGFTEGMVPVWNASQQRFVPSPYLPASLTAGIKVTVLSVLIPWAGVSLRPLESATLTTSLAGVTASSRVFIDSPSGLELVFFSAEVFNAPVTTLKATNMGSDSIALLSQVYQVWVIT